MPADLITVTIRVTRVLEALDVPYFIGGSLASTLYGMVRTTQDADIIAELRAEHIPVLIAELQHEFYIDEKMIADAITYQSSFNIVHRASMFKVGVFVPSSRNFIRQQFSRAHRENLSSNPQMTAYIASPEDTVLAKLEWYRLGRESSERQWRDVLGVLKVLAGELDIAYLRRTADELEIADLLDRALAGA